VLVAAATAATTVVAVGLLSAGTAAASINPSLRLNQSAGTSAAGTHNLGMTINFAPSSTSDTPKTLQIALPPGVIANADIDGGACLKTPAPSTPSGANAKCEVGTGTASATAPILGILDVPSTVDLTYYLVAPPSPGDLAGLYVTGDLKALAPINLDLGTISLGTGDVFLRATGDPAGVGLTIKLSLPNEVTPPNLPVPLSPSLTSISSTFNGLRYPSSCPSTPARVAISATSYADSTVKTTSAPLTVTGCSSAPYSPTLSVTAVKDPGDHQVTLTADVKQAASQLTTGSTQLNFPTGVLAPNLNVASALCTSRVWSKCTPVGSATATSPVYPTPLSGKAYLAGDSSGLELTLVFPQPFPLTLTGRVNLSAGSTTFAGEPDIPQTDLRVVLNGGPDGAFATTCQMAKGTATATFVSQNGDRTVHASDPFTVSGWQPCKGATPGKRGSGSGGSGGSGGSKGSGGSGGSKHRARKPALSGGKISGLLAGKPALRFKVTKGATKLSKLTIAVGGGLTFHRRRSHGKTTVKGVTLRGAKAKSMTLSSGRLVIALRRPASSVRVGLGSAALRESSRLHSQAAHHRLKGLGVKVAVADTAGRVSRLRLEIRKLGLPATHR
jgi:hypothetical protein